MGCVGSSTQREIGGDQQLGNTSSVTIGKNKPLSADRPKWKSETPITMDQLRRKRVEYWETQPAFEGRREIWDALRAACETEDNTLAQAIVDGASISLPTGSLTDAYDELGNHYVIPVYCISLPTNIIQSDENSQSDSKEQLSEQASGEELMIKVRLSDQIKDIRMNVRTGETIGALKKRVHADHGIPPSKQRCYFAGKLLYDKLTIADTKLSKGFVVQVIVAGDD